MRTCNVFISLCLLSLCVGLSGVAGELPAAIDLSVTPGSESADVVRVYGEASFDLMGSGGRSAAFGDMDGDGLSDLLIGCKEASSVVGVTASGTAYVVFGEKALDRQTLNFYTGEGTLDITRILGAEPEQRNGGVVAMGDVNGDGFDDAVIGASSASLPDATQCGKVTIVYGSAAIRGSTVDLSSTSDLTQIYGADSWEHFGWSLAVGDVNSDGYGDVISVAMPVGEGPLPMAGKSYIFFGSPNLPGETIQTRKSTVGQGQSLILDGISDGISIHNRMGFSVACGDVDGDGFDDMILGAPGMDGNLVVDRSVGGVFVVYGGSSLDGTVITLGQESGTETTVIGDDYGDNAGFSVASGDVNGDGYYDVILGAPYKLFEPYSSTLTYLNGAGAVFTVYGGPDIRGTTVDLSSSNCSSISGVTYILGHRIFTTYDYSKKVWRGGMTGWSVTSGDVNGDGLDDVIVGGMTGMPPGKTLKKVPFESGIADVIYGATGMEGTVIDLEADHAGVKVMGGHTEDRAGHTVASAGDMNGDGFAEFATSAPMAENPAIDSPTHEAGMVALIKGDGVAAKARRVQRTTGEDPPPLRFGTAARCLIDYATAGEVSQTTVTIQHNAPENPPGGTSAILPVQWKIDTSLDEFNADVSFRYTNVEAEGIDETQLTVFTSPDGSAGSWTWAGTQQVLNTDRNEIRVAGLSHFSLYSIAIIEEPTPTQTPEPSATPTVTETLEATLTPTVIPTDTPTPDPTQVLLERADLNIDGRIDVKDLLILEDLWLREVPE